MSFVSNFLFSSQYDVQKDYAVDSLDETNKNRSG